MDILALLAKWLATGPVGIILGILGLGGIGAALAYFAKKAKDKNLSNDIAAAAKQAGQESKDLTDNLRNNTIAMDRAIEEEKKRQKSSQHKAVFCPKQAKAGESFHVTTTGFERGEQILADKSWVVGYVSGTGTTDIVLKGAGVRTLDIKNGAEWVSATITIVE